MKTEHKKKTVKAPKKPKKADKPAPKKPAKVKERTRQPKAEPLPGMNVRVKELDDLAHDFAEARDSKNEAIGEEDRLNGEIFDAMRRHKIQVWKASGMEFARVPGGEKLRCRKLKDKSERASVNETAAGKPLAFIMDSVQHSAPAAADTLEDLGFETSDEPDADGGDTDEAFGD